MKSKFPFLLILLFTNSIFAQIKVGASNFEDYIPLLKNKNVGVIVNQTSVVENIHIVDCLLEKGINIETIFSPEHGFRGKADAGEYVANGVDKKTNIPVISLYGSNKKPSSEQLEGIDILLFDVQDVGVRFYTYISTMHYAMEACAENDKPIIILDRPNPNGHYVDGPVLNLKYKSFIGMHKIPIVHGLTIGELATMINNEKWLDNKVKCNLTVIKCINYSHSDFYKLPIPPSPNLPNMKSIYLYPSLCLLEGTNISCGRGTDKQFQIYGSPDMLSRFRFTPKPNEGSKNPKFKNKLCFGFYPGENNESVLQKEGFTLKYIIKANQHSNMIFNSNGFINKLSGNTNFKSQIENNISEIEIKKSWEPQLTEYKKMRKKYLLYPDFE